MECNCDAQHLECMYTSRVIRFDRIQWDISTRGETDMESLNILFIKRDNYSLKLNPVVQKSEDRKGMGKDKLRRLDVGGDYFGDLLNRQFCLCALFPDLPATPQVFCEAIIFFTHEARPSEKRKIKKVVSALLSFVCGSSICNRYLSYVDVQLLFP